MPTEKPRVTITMDMDTLAEIDAYRFDKKLKNQTQAILSLIERGLDELTARNEKAPSVSDEAMEVAKTYDGLDSWGKQAVRELAATELARVGTNMQRYGNIRLLARGGEIEVTPDIAADLAKIEADMERGGDID